MSDVANLISQLEQQKASIGRAIDALREITAPWRAERPGSAPSKDVDGNRPTPVKTGSPLKGRKMTSEQKRAISKAWTPERKQKFAEFHVQRMARERGEDPAKALREYRRRKQKEHAGATAPRKTSAKAVP